MPNRDPQKNYGTALEARRWIAKLVEQGMEEFADVLERLDKFIGLFK